MARFSNGDNHTTRRRAVESAISRIDLDQLARLAAKEVAVMADVGCGSVTIEELAATVPTRTVARSLGVDGAELPAVVAAVEAVADAIGRGRPVDDTTEERCVRLLDRFADHPDGAVAAVSVLYQNRDATAALLVASADHPDGTVAAVPGTVRQAVGDVSIGSLQLADGDLVRLEFTAAQQFGAGPHRCPGEAMARCLVNAILSAVDAAKNMEH